MPQGQCTLPADDSGRVLDRLAGLEQVTRPDDIQQALSATGKVNSRSCTLTHEVVLWVVLAMGLLTADDIATLEAEVKGELEDATREALAMPSLSYDDYVRDAVVDVL